MNYHEVCEHSLHLMEGGRVSGGGGISRQHSGAGRRHHEQVLHARRHVARGAQVSQAHVPALRAGLLRRPVVPRIWRGPSFNVNGIL